IYWCGLHRLLHSFPTRRSSDLERVPADIRAQGGVSRMSDPDMIDGIVRAVSIPVMAKARIGHFMEARVLQALGVDYIDESEVLRSEEHTSELQSRENLVCRLLL